MRLAAYIRVSSEGQVEHGYGLDIQRQAIETWANNEGHEIAVWAADEGVSGSNGFETREGLYGALQAVSDHAVDGVVIYSLDRLARKLTAQEAALAKVWDCGGHVYSIEQHGLIPEDDPDDPMRTAIRQMRGVFAQLERSMITKRLRDGKRI
ncbi:MAG: recombinase family protein [Acidimicrobiales bacterium]